MNSSTNTVRNAKFLFDRDFDEGDSAPSNAKAALEASRLEQIKAEARAAGMADGINKGREEKSRELEGQITQILEKIQRNMEGILQTCEEYKHCIVAEIQTLTIAALKKLHPELARKGEITEISAVLTHVMQEQPEEPRLLVAIRPEIFETLKDQLEGLQQHAGFGGKLILLPDSDLAPGDCRIEWQQGGIERDLKALYESIERVIRPEGANNGE